MYTKKTRVMIAGESGDYRERLREYLKDRDDFEIVEISSEEKDFLEEFYRLKPDILLMDMCPSTVVFLERLTSSSATMRTMRVVFLTHNSSPEVSYLLEKMGAASTIDETQNAQKIIEVLKSVSGKFSWCGKNCIRKNMQEIGQNPILRKRDGNTTNFHHCLTESSNDKFAVLSDREKEILSLIGYGYNSIEISKMLYISRRTVDAHRQHILDKLNIMCNSGLIRYAILFNKLGEFGPGLINECRLCCPPLSEIRKRQRKYPSKLK